MTLKRSLASIFSIILSLLLMASMLPALAFAEGEGDATEPAETTGDDLDALGVDQTQEFATMGSSIRFAGEDDVSGAEADDNANSFRFSNGEWLSSQDGADPSVSDNGIATFSLERNPAGYNVFNWFDSFSQGYCTGNTYDRGIDVSEHQGVINWNQVKAAGVDFAIIRCGYGQNISSQDDKQWLNNVKGVQAAGIPFGIYLYSYATDTTRALGEAEHATELLRKAGITPDKLAYPVYYDIEDASMPKGSLVTLAKTFCNAVQAKGYRAGIYSSTSWWNNYLNSSDLNSYYKWIAEWNASKGLSYSGANGFANKDMIWQFSDYGKVSGISGRVDLNYSSCGEPFSATGNTSASVTDQNAGIFRVKLENVKANKPVSYVNFAVWSDAGGQDDLKWYRANQAADGSYYYDVEIRNHKGDLGTYKIHPYLYTASGKSTHVEAIVDIQITSKVQASQPVPKEADFKVEMTVKGGEAARATSISQKVWYSSGMSTMANSLVTYPTSGSPATFNMSKVNGVWNSNISIHDLRKAGTYKVETWATYGNENKLIDSDTFTIKDYKDPGIPMYRLYNPNSGEHFYTADAAERDRVRKAGWRYEGIGWNAASGGSVPVYRLYSGTDHHYTYDVKEKNNLVKAGWKYEGIGWYSEDEGGQPLYRQYNPNVNPKDARNNSGSHNFTTDISEHNNLIRVGWRGEGIAWYGVW